MAYSPITRWTVLPRLCAVTAPPARPLWRRLVDRLLHPPGETLDDFDARQY